MSGRQDLKNLQPGQMVEEEYLLSNKQILISKTGNAYGALRLSDASGEREAKLWDNAQDLLTPLQVGQVVKVWAKVQAFQGQNQLVISRITLSPDADPTVFLPQGPRPSAQMWPEFDALLKKIANIHLKRLLGAIFTPAFRQRFGVAPAAKMAHHAYVGGLLEHTLNVAQLAATVAAHYPHLDRDLLLTGAFLHDIGKVEEFSLGPPIEYTDIGRLEGHIIIGLRQVDAAIDQQAKFPRDLALVLRHMIISHHGQEAFGSPQKPKIPEAMVLHTLDDMDAKTQMVQQILANARPDAHWSNYSNLLERHIYLLNSQGLPHKAYMKEGEEKTSPNAPELSLFSTQGD